MMILSKITQQSTRKTSFISNKLPVSSLSTIATSATSLLSSFDNGVRVQNKTTMNNHDTILLPSKKNVPFYHNRRYKSIQPSPSFQNTDNEEEVEEGLNKGINNNVQEQEEVCSDDSTTTTRKIHDIVNFPSSSSSTKDSMKGSYTPVLLNSKQHAVGYLNRILNARVYEAAIETQLQHAKSLSTVRIFLCLLLSWVFFLVGEWNVVQQRKICMND